ncbi:MAG TPA: ABC transporter substrate-binding protein [Stellaceae bacterium]|nr:ABC transporter substrate-binding protein [Stellaceae bacterium]
MTRRKLVILLGGVAWTGTRSVRAQSADAMPRVGFLMFGAPTEPVTGQLAATFETGLGQLGWKIGSNIRIDVRWAGNDAEKFRAYAVELVALRPDVIMAGASSSVAALRQLTHTIPIVFANVTDPVGQGFVETLAHPGGNVTGFTNYEAEMSGKWLSLLKQMAPSVSRVAVIFDPKVAPQADLFLASVHDAARSARMSAEPAPVTDDAEIDRAIGTFAQNPDGGLLILADLFTGLHVDHIIAAAARHHLPAVYPYSEHARRGGLIAYGVDTAEEFRGAASYVDRILKGAAPADLPIQQPTKFTLALNLSTAKALGLVVPQSLLATADAVIE